MSDPTTTTAASPPVSASAPAAETSGPPYDPATLDLDAINAKLGDASPDAVVRWVAEHFPDRAILSTSFGAQSAVMIDLITRHLPRIPVVFIDTGFHFPETYRFADELTARFNLNLKVYTPAISAAWMIQRHGKLWEQQTREALQEYDNLHKVEPMQRALDDLKPAVWFAGLRAQQTEHRSGLRRLERQAGVLKAHPILHWSRRDVGTYMVERELPYHPLVEQGYASIGDWHSTAKIGETDSERAGRFQGLKEECGIHIPQTPEEDQSRMSADL
ncbi:MAG: phosphoadenylyl-sulfate reductase [Planctomycetota bacterium]